MAEERVETTYELLRVEKDGLLIASIAPDGNLVFGPEFKATDAAREVWKILASEIPAIREMMTFGKTETRMDYISANAFIPRGLVSSTARRGSKWFDTLRVGDVVRCMITGTPTTICRAVVTDLALTTFEAVLDSATDNHVAFGRSPGDISVTQVRANLDHALRAAYGNALRPDAVFSKVFLLRLTAPVGADGMDL